MNTNQWGERERRAIEEEKKSENSTFPHNSLQFHHVLRSCPAPFVNGLLFPAERKTNKTALCEVMKMYLMQQPTIPTTFHTASQMSHSFTMLTLTALCVNVSLIYRWKSFLRPTKKCSLFLVLLHFCVVQNTFWEILRSIDVMSHSSQRLSSSESSSCRCRRSFKLSSCCDSDKNFAVSRSVTNKHKTCKGDAISSCRSIIKDS